MYNGSGTYNLYTPGNPVVTATTITSTWANNSLNDIASALSTAICKDGQTTTTVAIPFAQGWTSAGNINVGSGKFTVTAASGVITEVPRMGAYQWNSWNPSDVVGSFTNGSAAGTSLAATNYFAMVNAAGTVTFTFSKAGNYLMTVNTHLQAGAAYATTGTTTRTTIGGSATRFMSQTAVDQYSPISSVSIESTFTFAITATAGQTVTVLPSIAVSQGGGNTANYSGYANATATYVGT